MDKSKSSKRRVVPVGDENGRAFKIDLNLTFDGRAFDDPIVAGRGLVAQLGSCRFPQRGE